MSIPESSSMSGSSRRPGTETVRLVLFTATISIGSMAGGFNAYASPAIPDINDHRSPFHVSPEEQSWFVGLGYLSALIGALCTMITIDAFGRKLCLVSSSIPFVAGCVLIAGASNVYFLYAGRVLVGLANAQLAIGMPTYVVEMVPPHVRGCIVNMHMLFQNLSMLGIYILGAEFRYNWLAIACAIPTACFACLVISLPESPRWLLMRGRTEEAADVQRWLEGERTSAAVSVAQDLQESGRKLPWSDYFRSPLLKTIAISQVLIVVQIFSGAQVVFAFTVTIFQSTGVQIDAHMQTIIVGAMLVGGTLISVVIVDRLPHRLLFATSTFFMAVGMTGMGSFFFALDRDEQFARSSLAWLPLLSFVVFTVAYELGYGGLPAIIINEMFPTPARGRANSVCFATFSLCAFLATKFFNGISMSVGKGGAFWICGCVCLLGSIFALLFVPETKGKQLDDL